MKKLLILFMFLFIIPINKVDANNTLFEEVYLEKGKFLDDYTNKDYATYYKKLGKRRMFGWKIYKVCDEIPFVFKKETLFSYYNDGLTPFNYEYEFNYQRELKTSINYSGNIKVNIKNSEKKFSQALEKKINWDYSTSKSIKETEKISLKTEVDPQTMVNLYITGKGYLTNGVAKNFLFFINIEKGGFELLKITTEYQRLEKVMIR